MLTITLRKDIFSALAYLTYLIGTSSLEAANHTPHIEIATGGYLFDASFALYKPSSSSKLIANMTVLRPTHFAVYHPHQLVPIGAGQLSMLLTVTGSPTVVEIIPQSNGRHKITSLDIASSVSWYPTLKKMAAKIGSEYFAVDNYKKKPYQLQQHHKAHSSSIDIHPLQNCKLETTYGLRVTSHERRKLPLSGCLTVRVITQMKRNAQGKKELITEASFYTKENVTVDRASPVILSAQLYVAKNDPASVGSLSVLRFVNTKNGLKETFLQHINRSSIWYPAIKKMAEKSVKQYIQLKNSHDRLFRNAKIAKIKPTSATKQSPYSDGDRT